MKTISTNVGSELLNAIAKKADGARVEVGFFETAKYSDGTSVAAVAASNEFGVPSQGIPSRPFFRNAISKNNGWTQLAEQAMGAAARGKISTMNALEQMGLKMAADVKSAIVAGGFEPIAQSTIDARMARKTKGVDRALSADPDNKALKAKKAEKLKQGVAIKPLIDTGQMMQAVTYSVTEGKE